MPAAKLRIAVLYEPSDNTLDGAPAGAAQQQKRAGRRKPRERIARGHERRSVSREGRPKFDREEVLEALRRLGHDPFFYELAGEKRLLGLSQLEADLVFNLVEAYEGDDALEPHVAAFLDLLEVPYTGAGPQGLLIAQDKALAKKIFHFHKIRTPYFGVFYKGTAELPDDLQFPLIVKPANEDGSVGIDSGSVVKTVRELLERLHLLQEKFDCPALIEQYIEGRELYVGVLGNEKPEALPVIELDLSRLPKGMPKIAGREVKWEKGTEAYESTRSQPARNLEPDLTRRLQETAVAVYKALKLRDYGRIDMRLTPGGEIHVIEANPNPWLAPEAELAIAGKEAGLSYDEMLWRIVESALARYL